MDTYYVESFNNTMNIFHDKRIYFRKLQYEMRTGLTVCHWNENVDRDFTSIHWYDDPINPLKGKKVLVDYTTNYKANIWARWINEMYA